MLVYSGIFQAQRHERKVQNMFDLKYNLYQHVDKIKYEDKFPTQEDLKSEKMRKRRYLKKAVDKVYAELGIPADTYPFENLKKLH